MWAKKVGYDPMTCVPSRFFRAVMGAAVALSSCGAANTAPAAVPQVLSLADCLRIAMEKNHTRPASRFAVAMAEAQHRQALSGYWPQVAAKAGWIHLNEAPNFIFPASTMYIPPETVNVPAGTAVVTIPANSFGAGFPPGRVVRHHTVIAASSYDGSLSWRFGPAGAERLRLMIFTGRPFALEAQRSRLQ